MWLNLYFCSHFELAFFNHYKYFITGSILFCGHYLLNHSFKFNCSKYKIASQNNSKIEIIPMPSTNP